jgi:saccharopine dehydrogenase-like NADP-dependent oxidoreductase
MKLLIDELRLSEHREQLKEILERAVPVTFQDVVVTFCTVTGWRKGLLVQKSDARKIYHQQIGDESWSAIQITTAAGVCAVLDLHVAGRLPKRGLVRQEDVPLDEFLTNRFGEYYESQMATRYSSGVIVLVRSSFPQNTFLDGKPRERQGILFPRRAREQANSGLSAKKCIAK